MSNSLRRIYNSIDNLFDRGAISQDLRFSKSDMQSTSPKTAKHAFEKILPFVYELDKKASLKMIVSQQGIDNEGKSQHWEFFFDLIEKRAKLTCDWSLLWDESKDNYSHANIDFVAKPFPPADSPLRQMVKDGKMLNQQLVSMWKQESNRRPNLSLKFRDTSLIVKEFAQQGLDISQTEFSLSTGQDPTGKLCWLAQTKQFTYYSAFE